MAFSSLFYVTATMVLMSAWLFAMDGQEDKRTHNFFVFDNQMTIPSEICQDTSSRTLNFFVAGNRNLVMNYGGASFGLHSESTYEGRIDLVFHSNAFLGGTIIMETKSENNVATVYLGDTTRMMPYTEFVGCNVVRFSENLEGLRQNDEIPLETKNSIINFLLEEKLCAQCSEKKSISANPTFYCFTCHSHYHHACRELHRYPLDESFQDDICGSCLEAASP